MKPSGRNKIEIDAPWVGYIRVSSQEQAESGLSLEAQRERIRGYCIGKGVQLDEILEDAAESAKSLNRPAVQRLLQLVAAGTISGVVIYKLDRLTRSVRDLNALVEEFQKTGVALASVTEALDTSTATGRMMINIIGTIAQWEREIICERTKTALGVKLRRGEHAGNVAYGFSSTGKKGKAVENPEEQLIIRRIMELRLGGGSYRRRHTGTLAGITKALNAEGYKTRRGGEWRLQYVANVIKQEEQRRAVTGQVMGNSQG